MLKAAPLYAAVLTLCACTSAPTVKFPSGSASRVAINSPMKPMAAAVLPVQAVSTTPSGQSVSATGALKKPAIAAEPPPEPLQLKVYLVNANERSMMMVMRRWARTARVDFTWESEVDYPITSRMRAIDATDLEGALEQMRSALAGVRLPLVITMTADGLVVQSGEAPAAVEAPAVEAPAAAVAPITTSAPVLTDPVAVAEKTPEAWSANDGKSLHEIVGKWAALAGVKLVWESKSDHPVSDAVRGASYSGSLREALGQLAGQYGEFKTPIGMKFLEKGSVLRVYDMVAAP